MQNDFTKELAALYDSMDVAVMVLDEQSGILLYINRRVCRDIQLSEEQILGFSYKEVFWKEFHPVYESLARACKDGNTHTDIYHWTSHTMWEQIAACQVKWKHGQEAILLTITNITDVSRSLYEYRQMAYYDSFLQLPNSRSMQKDIEAIQSFEDIGLIRFDVHRLSNISGIYGWNVGDLLLERFRDWLLETNLPATTVYRIYEAGFCLLIYETTLQKLNERAKQITQRFQQPWEVIVNGCVIPVYCHISMGIVWGRDVSSDTQSLLLNTLSGHIPDDGSHIIYNRDYFKQQKEQIQIHQELVRCVKQDMTGFSVHYQPIVEAKSGAWKSVEALCRWEAPNFGPISPSVFIKEAERMRLVGDIDDWAYKTAMEECGAIMRSGVDFRLDINFSPQRKLDDAFIRKLIRLSEEVNFPISKLNLEITETAKMDFSNETLINLNSLLDFNVHLVLDDFGTGYSTFENLLQLPASVMKTERSMILNIEADSNKQYLMQMLVRGAHYANMLFVAEGVETEEQRKLMVNYGVDYMQGYFFSRPMPIKLLRESSHRFA